MAGEPEMDSTQLGLKAAEDKNEGSKSFQSHKTELV